MPTYQYACTDCGEGLEVQQSFSDDTLTVCPACEGRLRKVFGAVGVVFKGSGFYRTDSRAAAAAAAGKAGSNGDGKRDAGSDGESKPPAKESKVSKDSGSATTDAAPAAAAAGAKDAGKSSAA